MANNTIFDDVFRTRACLENAFCKMCVTVCGRFVSDEGVVAGYDNRIRGKNPAKWGVQIAGMIFQTRSSIAYLGCRCEQKLFVNLLGIFFRLCSYFRFLAYVSSFRASAHLPSLVWAPKVTEM